MQVRKDLKHPMTCNFKSSVVVANNHLLASRCVHLPHVLCEDRKISFSIRGSAGNWFCPFEDGIPVSSSILSEGISKDSRATIQPFFCLMIFMLIKC